MATSTTFKIEGLRELEAALGELPKATGKNVLRRVLMKRGKPLADDMRAGAPDDPRTEGKYDLRSSIGVSTVLGKRQKGLHKKMFLDDKASVEVFVGAGVVPHAHLVEYGSVHNKPPIPFARSAWDSGQDRLLDGLKDDLWAEIKKAADRLARKTARLAAKAAAK